MQNVNFIHVQSSYLSRVNAVSLQCRRDMSEVKKKWQDLQSSANKKEWEQRKYLGQTGGGPAHSGVMKSWEEIVCLCYYCYIICFVSQHVLRKYFMWCTQTIVMWKQMQEVSWYVPVFVFKNQITSYKSHPFLTDVN